MIKLLYNTFIIDKEGESVNCMRCGKENKGKDVFCPDCLSDMERYPVKPGTVIHIPAHKGLEDRQQRRKKELTAEEQLAIAEKQILNLKRWLVVMTTVAALLGTLLYFSITTPRAQNQEQNPQVRNYTSMTQD